MNTHRHAVQVKNVTKSFFLPHNKNNSIKTAITQAFKIKARGGEIFSPLNGISFNVEKGDFFGVLGRNGSGKSTLLKIISEIYQPTSGSVKHEGKLVSFIELGVGFKAELSGRENVYLNGGLLGFSKPEIDEMYDDIVSFAELEDYMGQRLKNYSSGMKVRLAFSVAIRAKADILILDEVLAVGDANFQKKCTDYFKTLKDDGKTVILVTHTMGHVRKFCNRAVVIEEGKIIYDGNADEAADRYLELFSTNKEEKPVGQADESRQVAVTGVSSYVKSDKVIVNFDVSSAIDHKAYIAIDVMRNNELVGGVSYHQDQERTVFLEKDGHLSVKIELDNIFGRGVYDMFIAIKNPANHEQFTIEKCTNAFKITEASNEYLPVIIPSELIIK